MEKKKRMLSQDIAKAIMILSVVVTHTLGDRASLTNPLAWYNYLIMCPMGFFFLISGYNFHPGKRSAKESIWIRFKQLILPLIEYTVAFCVLSLILNLTMNFSSISSIVKSGYLTLTGQAFEKSLLYYHILNDTNTLAFTLPSWFIVFMFTAYIMFFLIVDFAMKNNKRFISVNAGLVILSMILFKLLNGVANPLGIIDAPLICSLLLIGCYLGNKKFLETETYGKKWTIINTIVATAICLIIAIIIPRACMLPGGMFCSEIGIGEIPLTVPVSILYTYSLINICKLFEKIPVVNKALLWLGRNSLRIFLLHMPIANFITFFTGIPSELPQTTGEFFAIFGLTLAISVLITLIIEFLTNLIRKNKAKKQEVNMTTSEAK